MFSGQVMVRQGSTVISLFYSELILSDKVFLIMNCSRSDFEGYGHYASDPYESHSSKFIVS